MNLPPTSRQDSRAVQARHAAAVQLYVSGLSLREAGEKCGVSYATVRYALQSARVPLRPVGRGRARLCAAAWGVVLA